MQHTHCLDHCKSSQCLRGITCDLGEAQVGVKAEADQDRGVDALSEDPDDKKKLGTIRQEIISGVGI